MSADALNSIAAVLAHGATPSEQRHAADRLREFAVRFAWLQRFYDETIERAVFALRDERRVVQFPDQRRPAARPVPVLVVGATP